MVEVVVAVLVLRPQPRRDYAVQDGGQSVAVKEDDEEEEQRSLAKNVLTFFICRDTATLFLIRIGGGRILYSRPFFPLTLYG